MNESEKQQTLPNLFDYATSELSQDAVIGYMLAWANPHCKKTDAQMHDLSTKFLDKIFAKHGLHDISYESVVVKKQYKNIDILCIVNNKYYIIIEDKTDTTHHSGQLSRYRECITTEKVDQNNILTIYYKTGEEFTTDSIENNNYKFFSKEDILEVIPESVDNQILKEYRRYITKLRNQCLYAKLPFSQWSTSSWICLCKDLQKSGICFGNTITHARGNNVGAYFNYTVIDMDGVGFYLRLAFDKNRVEFKLETEGQLITSGIFEKYLHLIKDTGLQIHFSTTPKKPKKIKTIGFINDIVSLKDDCVDFEAVKNKILDLQQIHQNIVDSRLK